MWKLYLVTRLCEWGAILIKVKYILKSLNLGVEPPHMQISVEYPHSPRSQEHFDLPVKMYYPTPPIDR